MQKRENLRIWVKELVGENTGNEVFFELFPWPFIFLGLLLLFSLLVSIPYNVAFKTQANVYLIFLSFQIVSL